MLKYNILGIVKLKQQARFIIKSILGWVIYACSYIILKNVSASASLAGYFSLLGEVGLDGVAAILSLQLLKNSANKYNKDIFRVLFISFISAVMADFIYNIILNLTNIKYIDPSLFSLFDFPFLSFLFFQIIAWIWIITLNSGEKIKTKKFFHVPYVIVSLLLFVIFMFGVSWKIEYFSQIGIFQIIDTALEVIGFALVTICLARAKSKLVRFVGTGYLIVVSSDFIIRYQVVSGRIPYLSSLETTWVLGLLLICLGMYRTKRSNKKNALFKLLPVNSIQSQITIWLLIFCLSSVFLFASLCYVFSQDNGCQSHIVRNLLSMLVPFSALVIISSSYLSTQISYSISRLEDFIKSDNMSKTSYKNKFVTFNKDKVCERFEIYEMKKLDNFIMKTISKLHVANCVKSKFLMDMSHDFRTPASGIYHMSRSIHKRIEDPELKKLQKLIVDSSEKLMNFIEDVLDYSRLDNDKYELNMREVDIVSIINEVIMFVSAKVKEKRLNINAKFDKSPINYKGDKLMIHRIMLNIISNAIKFTHAGEITISASEEKIDNTNWLVIKVKDTGIGIDKSHHKLIFEAFTRVESSETARYPGIGLGLGCPKTP